VGDEPEDRSKRVGAEEKHLVEIEIAQGMENAAWAKPAAEVLHGDEIQNTIQREKGKITKARQPWRTDRRTAFESADVRPGE
jgi:hypothetical protein